MRDEKQMEKKGTEGDRDEDEKAEEGTIRVKMNGELRSPGLKASKKLKRWLQTITSPLFFPLSVTLLFQWYKESRVERTWPNSRGSGRPEASKSTGMFNVFLFVPIFLPLLFYPFLSLLTHPSIVPLYWLSATFNFSVHLFCNQILVNKQKQQIIPYYWS